jgi:hypothetical protein
MASSALPCIGPIPINLITRLRLAASTGSCRHCMASSTSSCPQRLMRPDPAARTCAAPIDVRGHPGFDSRETLDEPLIGGTSVLIIMIHKVWVNTPYGRLKPVVTDLITLAFMASAPISNHVTRVNNLFGALHDSRCSSCNPAEATLLALCKSLI